MNRKEMIRRLKRTEGEWDFAIIGGGATGLGVAIEAASRGYLPVLIEQSDFSKGTSSRSTKLVHGGVRYLQQGNISLVLEALKERGLMRRNAPHLVHNLPFVVPNYDWWEGPFYGIGLKLYDALAGRHGFGHSKGLSREKTLEFIPTLEPKGLRGGIVYYDGQFDDARLAIHLARTAHEQGAVVVNYMGALRLIKENDMVRGVIALDKESGETHEIRARVVINATGVYADAVRRMDEPDAPLMVTPSQGVHIVLDKRFLPGETAIMVPHTDDGRVLFAIPWHNRVVVGTTDTFVRDLPLDPKPLPEELDFLLSHTARYLTQDPRPQDVLSAFAGLRPLVAMGEGENTAAISRDHTLNISRSGLVTITGGKWTTYRRMAEDTIDHALVLAQLEERPSVSRELPIHGYHRNPEIFGVLAAYGSDASEVKNVFEEDPRFGKPLHPEMSILAGEVIWAVRHEMARTVEDFLSRRTRALLLDARKSMEMAPAVAAFMAEALGRDDSWRDAQVEAYFQLARDYLMP